MARDGVVSRDEVREEADDEVMGIRKVGHEEAVHVEASSMSWLYRSDGDERRHVWVANGHAGWLSQICSHSHRSLHSLALPHWGSITEYRSVLMLGHYPCMCVCVEGTSIQV